MGSRTATSVPTGCGPIAYGSALWEFTDTVYDAVADEHIFLDEDGNGMVVPPGGGAAEAVSDDQLRVLPNIVGISSTMMRFIRSA